ncbi:MAG: tripartite tricarboxylate transporter substrate binding protein [Xanthobacteraceae bacterium]
MARSEQAYPIRPIRLIVPYPAGGATDVVARIITEKMSEELGQQIIVDNRPGAGTMIGANFVARSAPDGYTMLMGDTGTYALNPTLYKNLTYDPMKDFSAVSLTGRVPLILVTNPRVLDVDSVEGLIAAAKKNPGKINYGAPGPGSPIHLAMELFKRRVGIDIAAIPYKGGADALNDLLGGRVSLLFVDAATGLSYIRSGQLRALGVAAANRIPAMPKLPTISEVGVPGFEAWAWNGLAVPAGTPQEIIAKLNAACRKALTSPDVESRLAAISVIPAPSSPDEFAAYIKSETAKWRNVITAAGITLN